MKPAEKKPEEVYRIIDKSTGAPVGSYSRAYCDEYDFGSVESARDANCHGVFEDKAKFKIAKYKVTYELLDDDCDGAEGFVSPPPPEPGTTVFMLKQWQDSIMEDLLQRFKESFYGKK